MPAEMLTAVSNYIGVHTVPGPSVPRAVFEPLGGELEICLELVHVII